VVGLVQALALPVAWTVTNMPSPSRTRAGPRGVEIVSSTSPASAEVAAEWPRQIPCG